MIISNCPRCHEGFRVPSGPIPEDAYAHCPWCRETFPITEVLGSLPPQLQILSADGRPLVITETPLGHNSGLQLIDSSRREKRESFAETVIDDDRDDSFELYDRDDRGMVETVSAETVAETVADDDWQHDGTFEGSGRNAGLRSDDDLYSTLDGSESSPIHSMNVATSKSGRKRKGSGIGTFIGIVLGGAASIPIAGGLLSLMGRTPDWGFWPFLGETRSSAVRAAPLPESQSQLDPISPNAAPLRFNRDQNGMQPSADPAVSAAHEIMKAGLGNDSVDETQTTATTSIESSPGRTSPQDADSSDTAADANVGVSPRSDNVVRTNTEDPQPETPIVQASSAQNTETTPSTAAPAQSTTTAPPAAMSDADAIAIRASQMIDVLIQDNVDEVEQKRRLAMTYQTIASAAASFDEPDESLQNLADKIVSSPLRPEFQAAGWKWLQSKNRSSNGIALIGRVSLSDDNVFLTGESGEKMAIICEEELPDMQEVLVLGRLINQSQTIRVVHVVPLPSF